MHRPFLSGESGGAGSALCGKRLFLLNRALRAGSEPGDDDRYNSPRLIQTAQRLADNGAYALE